MGTWVYQNYYQKNQACELNKHTRPMNDATPSPVSSKRWGTEHWSKVAPTNLWLDIQCMYKRSTHDDSQLCPWGFSSAWFPPTWQGPLELPLAYTKRLKPALHQETALCLELALCFGSPVPEQLCDWAYYVTILFNHLQWLSVSLSALCSCLQEGPFELCRGFLTLS
jgi:hypothetical protein